MIEYKNIAALWWEGIVLKTWATLTTGSIYCVSGAIGLGKQPCWRWLTSWLNRLMKYLFKRKTNQRTRPTEIALRDGLCLQQIRCFKLNIGGKISRSSLKWRVEEGTNRCKNKGITRQGRPSCRRLRQTQPKQGFLAGTTAGRDRSSDDCRTDDASHGRTISRP